MRKSFAFMLVGLTLLVWGAKVMAVGEKSQILNSKFQNGVEVVDQTDVLRNVLDKSKPNWIRQVELVAVERGVEANTIVLLMLLPLIATLVSVLHYIVGLSGYGIFIPTMVAVTFLATGIFGGLTLFAIILGVSMLSNWVLRRFKLHFWPARSINLMFISIGDFGLMAVSTYFQILDISKISIFPILIMILLVEEFVRTQLSKSKSEAMKLTAGTLALAMVGSISMSISKVQEWVLLNPGWVILAVLIINIVVGRYTGIRLTEIKRFKKAIRRKN
ncbi:hypothetical protein KBC75_03650 [Candidatus Shapirobacteria bacterium]|nr:hypothetical protein [Candidatus Shapirobacteria bacterium]